MHERWIWGKSKQWVRKKEKKSNRERETGRHIRCIKGVRRGTRTCEKEAGKEGEGHKFQKPKKSERSCHLRSAPAIIHSLWQQARHLSFYVNRYTRRIGILHINVPAAHVFTRHSNPSHNPLHFQSSTCAYYQDSQTL